MNALSERFGDSYLTAAPYFETQRLLCLWFFARQGSSLDSVSAGHCTWHGHLGHRSSMQGWHFHPDTVLVPSLWWCRDRNVFEKLQTDLEAFNISLQDLLPDA